MTREEFRKLKQRFQDSESAKDLYYLTKEILEELKKYVDYYDPEKCSCGGEWIDDGWGDVCKECNNIKGWSL